MNMNYKKYFKRYVRSRKPITVPKGPSMLQRKKKTTIRERKLREDLLKKEEARKREEKIKFKAKEVPANVTTNLYGHLQQVQEQRRQKRIRDRAEEIKNADAAFVFAGSAAIEKRKQEKQRVLDLEAREARQQKRELARAQKARRKNAKLVG